MSRSQIALISLGAVLLLAIGFVLGRQIRLGRAPGTELMSAAAPIEAAHSQTDEHAHAEEVIELSSEAYENLGLREAPVERTDYWRTLRVPAVVIEKPGHSSHGLAAPVHGIVRRVLAVPGQAVAPGDALVELRVTDEELSQAQLNLLQDITRLEVIATELERLAPLIADGSVSGRQQRELIYEQRQLTAKRELHEQALLLHGLDETQVEDIVKNKNLVRDFTVRLTADHHTSIHREVSRSFSAESSGPGYTVERIVALPGTSVQRGDDLCELAYHAELYIKGQAFENELEQVGIAADRGWPITAEFGIHDEVYERTDLSIQYIDNHVDTETQTFAFYVPVVNEVTRDVVNDQGARFRTWRLKPGQRARLKIPVEKWEDQIVLPAEALVEEGLDVFVFRRHDHTHLDPDVVPEQVVVDQSSDGMTGDQDGSVQAPGVELAIDHDHEHPHDHIEFERVPVEVLYRSDRDVVLNADGALQVGDVVALNRAYEINLALQRQAGEGGPEHEHEHEH